MDDWVIELYNEIAEIFYIYITSKTEKKLTVWVSFLSLLLPFFFFFLSGIKYTQVQQIYDPYVQCILRLSHLWLDHGQTHGGRTGAIGLFR